ncbi:MAG TPA: sigma-70 family RNA polymerase sigma factor [Verrucomicrobiae bacterium]|nr:sigma-70 family RNA polymerase sigma factor [Verrucomicrobiae bacterium]
MQTIPSHEIALESPLANPLIAPRADEVAGHGRPERLAGASAADIAALTRALSQGEEHAFHLFYDLYVGRLLRYLLVLARGREDTARDVLQQTLVRVARHAKPFDREEKFWSWLTVVARTAMVDERRKQNRYLAFLDRFLHRQPADGPWAEPEAQIQLSTLLEEEVERLPTEERALIHRKYFFGVSVREIADETQTTSKAIEARLVRTRRKLKKAVLARLHDETSDLS